MKHILLYIVGFMFSGNLFSQLFEDSTTLKTIYINGYSNIYQSGGVVRNLTPNSQLTLAQNITENGGLYIKQYGINSLASTSIRGMGAQHTAILWNGINLQSALNGIKDLNLIPMFFLEKASIETASNSGINGQGTIAGAVKINNQLVAEKNIALEIGYGSFEKHNYGVGISYFYRKFTFKSRGFIQKATNDFEYHNYFKINKPIEKMRNSNFFQKSFMQEVGFKANNKHNFYLNYWQSFAERRLPSPIGAINTNEERQIDKNIKILMKHDFVLNKNISNSNKLCFLQEGIDYYNLLFNPALSQAVSKIAETQWKFRLNNQFTYLTSLDYNHQNAFADGYINRKRELLSFFNNLSYSSKKTNFNLGLRQLTYNKKVQLSPEFGLEQQIIKPLKFKLNIARSFRLPSFNDLYWSSGGNKDLKPEVGYKSEGSLSYEIKGFKFESTIFFVELNDWILWSPSGNSGIWKADNAKKVRSKGIEIQSDIKILQTKWHQMGMQLKYQFVDSRNIEVYENAKTSLNRLLFYTPKHTGTFSFNYKFKKLSFASNITYYGKVYTTSDNAEDQALPGYFIVNCHINQKIKIKKSEHTLVFSVLNMLNNDYQVMQNRPMPLRSYQITLKSNINYAKN